MSHGQEHAYINKSQRQSLLHCFLFDPSIYISLLVSIEGKISSGEIKEAVEKAYTQNETTMSKVVLEQGKAYFQNISETGCKVFIEERDWREIMYESERNTFKINQGELFRTYIIPKEEGYQLLVMAHHIAGDGKALLIILEDILANLSGKEVEYKPLNTEWTPNMKSGLKAPLAAQVFIKSLNYIWEKNGKVFSWDDYYEIHEKFWKRRKSDVQFEMIEKEELETIKAECRALGVTVNSYIITKILQKYTEYETFSFPISLRGKNRSISNQVILVRLKYKYDLKKTFNENTAAVHRKIQQYVENERKKYFIFLNLGLFNPILVDSSLMYTYAGYKNRISKIAANLIGYSGKNKTHLGITNLTNIEIQADYGNFKVTNAAGIAARMSASRAVICFGSFQGRMTIAYSNVKLEA